MPSNKYGSIYSKNTKYGNYIDDANLGRKGRAILQTISQGHPIVKQFYKYRIELDDKHDRFENLAKFSRDITIESKRIIFFLHTLDTEKKTDSVLDDAKVRLEILVKTAFRNMALELRNHDPYQYLRSFTNGLQEYTEALTFHNFLKINTLLNWIELIKNLSGRITVDEVLCHDYPKSFEIYALFSPNEYILGIADFTGELMKKCINNIAVADLAICYKSCDLVKEIYKGYFGCRGIGGREIRNKLQVLRQSLIKLENVCYAVKIRGSEIPKYMLVDIIVGAENYNIESDGCKIYSINSA